MSAIQDFLHSFVIHIVARSVSI